METLPLSYTKPEEKDGSGHLLPDVRDRVMEEIENYIKNSGYINYSFLSEKLGLNKLTVRDLVSETVEKWRGEDTSKVEYQIKWFENLLVEMNEHPDNFDSKRIAMIGLRTGIIDKINGLKKLITPGTSISLVKEEINNNVFNVWPWPLKPKTIEALRKMKELENQQVVQ